MGQTSPLACEKCPDFDRLLNTGHDRPVVNITDCPQVEGIYIQHARYMSSSMLTFASFRNSSDLHIYKDLYGK